MVWQVDRDMDQTMIDLPGMAEALARAQRLEAEDAGFQLDDQPWLEQGRNNRVLAGRYHERAVVFKYYDDCINKPGARDRKATEAFALQQFGKIPAVPRLLLEADDCIAMERKPGVALDRLIREAADEQSKRALLEHTGEAIGRLAAQMAMTPFAEDDAARFCTQFHEGQSLAERCEALLDAACKVCNHEAALHAHEATIRIARSALPTVLDEPPVVYKYDNNFSNVLIDGGQIAGIIDFEQCYLGTETILLGALFDTVPEVYPLFPDRPSWVSVKSGYEAARKTEINDVWRRHILAMAMLNHWYRIVTTWQARGGTLGNFLPRFEHRLVVLASLHGEASR